MCKCFFGFFQYNGLVKGEDCVVDEATGQVTTTRVWRKFWLHDPAVYKAYDTYAKIIRTNSVGYDGKILAKG